MRIASYCHQGVDKSGAENESRLQVLNDLIKQITSEPDWHNLDALILPGGFFEIEQQRIEDSSLFPLLKRLARALDKTSPGAHLVIGVDTRPSERKGRLFGGQQLALAFNKAGISGFARKIFPVEEDINGQKWPVMLVHETDFTDQSRYISLKSGGEAALCVCYDMFGLADTLRGKKHKLGKIAILEGDDGVIYAGTEARKRLKTKTFPEYRAIIDQKSEDLRAALATIHRFAASGRDVFWHRHGIASASAGLNGAAAIGAAHFGKLPKSGQSTLASHNVPRAHLDAVMQRRKHSAQPERDVIVGDTGSPAGIARLFTL